MHLSCISVTASFIAKLKPQIRHLIVFSLILSSIKCAYRPTVKVSTWCDSIKASTIKAEKNADSMSVQQCGAREQFISDTCPSH